MTVPVEVNSYSSAQRSCSKMAGCMQAWLGLEYISRVALWALFFAWGMSVVQVPYGRLLGLLLVKLCHLMSVPGSPTAEVTRAM